MWPKNFVVRKLHDLFSYSTTSWCRAVSNLWNRHTPTSTFFISQPTSKINDSPELRNIALHHIFSEKYVTVLRGSYPHHGGNWKFGRGGGIKDQRNSGGEGGWMIDLVSRCPSIQHGFKYRSSCSKILSHLLSRSFTWKNSSLNTCILIAFLQKALWMQTSAYSMLLPGNGCHYLLSVYMESPCGPKSTGN